MYNLAQILKWDIQQWLVSFPPVSSTLQSQHIFSLHHHNNRLLCYVQQNCPPPRSPRPPSPPPPSPPSASPPLPSSPSFPYFTPLLPSTHTSYAQTRHQKGVTSFPAVGRTIWRSLSILSSITIPSLPLSFSWDTALSSLSQVHPVFIKVFIHLLPQLQDGLAATETIQSKATIK